MNIWNFFEKFLNSIGLICTISGITVFGAVSIASTIFLNYKNKKLYFTKRDIYEATWGYVEPRYKLENCNLKGKLAKILLKASEARIIFVIGEVGSGKTSLINRFIWKYNTRLFLTKKKIRLIQGLECSDILYQIDQIDSKEDTILILDGLEEAYLYQSNNTKTLQDLKECVNRFSKVIITMNCNFYKKYQSLFAGFYNRSVGTHKILPIKISLVPFSDKMIAEYIRKNIKIFGQKKLALIEEAQKRKIIFSCPLILSFINILDTPSCEHLKLVDIWGEIFEKSFKWQANKYPNQEQGYVSQLESHQIMNRISYLYSKGNLPVLSCAKSKNYNILLYYNKRRKEYRFKHCIFLFYNTVRKFYSKFPENPILIRQVKEHQYLGKLYFEKVMKRNSGLLRKKDWISFQCQEYPMLFIKSSTVFNDKHLLGLTKSLFDYPVMLDEIKLSCASAYQIARKYLLSISIEGNIIKLLDLNSLKIDEKHLAWWFFLPVDALDISNTKIMRLEFPQHWLSIRSLKCNNLSLLSYSQINAMIELEDLELSRTVTYDFFKSIKTLPENISVDLAYCKISNGTIPEFLFTTVFDGLYLDFNELVSADFINNITFSRLDLCNNPIKDNIPQNVKHKVICNFYFKSESLTNLLCKNGEYLTHAEAKKINKIDISSEKDVESLEGIEKLPFLDSITISTFQSTLLNESLKRSFFRTIFIETYGLNQHLTLQEIHQALFDLIINGSHCSDEHICSSCKVIMDFTSQLFDSDYSSKDNYAITVGTPKLAEYMNVDLGDFYKKVIDAYYYAFNFWKGDIEIQLTKNRNMVFYCNPVHDFDKIAKKDYKKAYMEICQTQNIQIIVERNMELDLLSFFEHIRQIYDMCIRHAPSEMEHLLCTRIGKSVNVHYVYPNR